MIKRRRLVALVSVIALIVIAFVTIVTGLIVTRTNYGQEELRRFFQNTLAASVRGKVYVGPISGGFLTGITVDSFAIRDADNDSLFISTGRITASYDPRDLLDKRVWLRNVTVEHPLVYLRQHASGRWNFKEIFKSYDKKNNLPKAPGRNFGDYFVIDTAHVRNGTLVLQMPWVPDDTLHGARLDSAVKHNLGRPDKEIRHVKDEGKPGFARTWRWTKTSAVVSHMRLADPDSDKLGRLFVFDTIQAVESDPPFDFRNVRGTMRNLGDSIWVDVAHFDLPQSSGAGGGKIVWGSDLPVRYDINVRGDSVALRDVSWVYPTLPQTGGGKTMLHIVNEPSNLHVIDYKLTNMDVSTTGSHLTGDMTFAVGGPVLVVKDVKMSAQPFDFDLLRALNGKPFPVDWRGQLYGSVRARGGPLTHFLVDESDVTFRDAHVRGAVSHVGGRGGLNILEPAYTSFLKFQVNAPSVDLRSIEYLYPNFPRLGGTISGTATLDSSWLDVRFANADVTHRDGPGEPSHLTGNGRVTWGAQYLTYDIDAQAAPLSLGMIARSYPKLPLTGVLNGPVKLSGTVKDLQLTTSLQGPAGALSFDGRVDIDPPGYGIRGSGQVNALAVHQLLDPSRLEGTVRPAVLTGHYDVALAGDSLANLDGSAAIDLARADIDGLRIFPSMARLRFANRKLLVDTLRLETTAATLVARGGLGLPNGVSDSLRFRLAVDSLGGFRRYLEGSGTRRDSVAADSLAGQLTLNGMAYGRVDSLDVSGVATGTGLALGTTRGRSLGGRFVIRNILQDPTGLATLRADTLTVAGVLLDSLDARLQLAGRSHAAFAVTVQSDNGPTARLVGNASSTGGAIGAQEAVTRIAFDTVGLTVGDSRWHLLGPSHVSRDSLGLAIDSLVLGNGAGGRVAVRGAAPQHAPVSLELTGDSIALSDFGALAQLQSPLGGHASITGRVTGTRASPVMQVDARMANFAYGGVHVERATATGSYRDRSFGVAVDLFRNRVPALHATMTVPVTVTLFGAERLNAPIRGSVRADSADLAVVEMLSPSLQKGAGRLTANLDFTVTPRHKSINGLIAVRNGQIFVQNAGVTLRSINGAVRFEGRNDSVQVDLSAVSGATPSSRIALRGFVNYAQWDAPRFNLALSAHNFHALDRRTLASLDISTTDSLRLVGTIDDAALTGTLRVERGEVYLPERDLLRKQVVDLSGDQIFQIIDSTDARTRQIIPNAPSRLVQNLRLEDVKIVLGDEVWLKSREANIKLGGSLSVRSAEKQSSLTVGRKSSRDTVGLALEGTLTADRGTYTLDLAPAPVQREFAVQRGTITFFGTTDDNPQVDIIAQHAVKRANQADLVIQVHLTGFLYPNPSIELSSLNEPYLSTSDLVSYLVTGQPIYALTSGELGVVQQVSSVVAPTLSAVAAAGLRGTGLGALFDQINIQSGVAPTTLGTSTTSQPGLKDWLFGARLGAEKQISNNLFFSLSAGLCSFNREYTQATPNQNALTGFVDALAGKLEYRFNPQLALQAGTDPPTSALYCGRSNISLGSVVQTPRQWGLSLLQNWHF
jgi:translocation and assembly module TamB